LPLDRVLKPEIAVEPFYLLHTLPSQPSQGYLVDLAAGGYYVHEHRQLHRQFENHFALAVIALGYDAFHVGEEGVGKIGRTILGSKTADIESDGLFNKF
jgi:hypothetical protein